MEQAVKPLSNRWFKWFSFKGKHEKSISQRHFCAFVLIYRFTQLPMPLQWLSTLLQHHCADNAEFPPRCSQIQSALIGQCLRLDLLCFQLPVNLTSTVNIDKNYVNV